LQKSLGAAWLDRKIGGFIDTVLGAHDAAGKKRLPAKFYNEQCFKQLAEEVGRSFADDTEALRCRQWTATTTVVANEVTFNKTVLLPNVLVPIALVTRAMRVYRSEQILLSSVDLNDQPPYNEKALKEGAAVHCNKLDILRGEFDQADSAQTDLGWARTRAIVKEDFTSGIALRFFVIPRATDVYFVGVKGDWLDPTFVLPSRPYTWAYVDWPFGVLNRCQFDRQLTSDQVRTFRGGEGL
jgi:hypothetical protein